MYVSAQFLSRVWLFATPDPGIEPAPPVASALAGVFFTTEPPGKPAGIEWKKNVQFSAVQTHVVQYLYMQHFS